MSKDKEIYDESIDMLYKEINKLYARNYFLEREIKKYKRLLEIKERHKEIPNV